MKDDYRSLSRMGAQEFTQDQLAGKTFYCRHCAENVGLAVPMVFQETVELDEQLLPAGVGTFDLYQCPRCGHRGMVEL